MRLLILRQVREGRIIFMLRQEWKKLISNKILLAVTIAVIIIPAIYTTLFLGSMWDPYGNAGQLPTAVVNHDRPVVFEGKTLNLGKDLMEELKGNNSLDFCFPSDEDAEEGLQKGRYYMVITIPENFSESAASLTEEAPEKMVLRFKTTPGTNYIASKMSETAMKELKNSIREEVTRSYAQIMLDKAAEAAEGMMQAADGVQSLDEGASSLGEGVAEAGKGGARLASGAAAADESMVSLNNGLNLLEEESSALPAAASALDEGTDVLSDGAQNIAQGLDSLSGGVNDLQAGADSAADACSQLSGQIPQLQSGIESLRSGMSDLSGGISELKTGTSKLAENAPSLTAGIAQASGGAEQIQQQGTLALRRGAADLNDGLGRLGEGAADLKNGTSLLASAASRISAEAGILSDAGKEQAEDTAEMFAAPLEIEEEQITYVADNGHAMAPYMMSVGLWVGCIAFCLMYPLTSCPGKMDSGLKWWFSKASVLVVTAVLQAVVMLAALAVFDGFDPERAGLTALTACAASVAFMSVMYFFTSLLGRVGSFLMLVFMVVQLAGSAGTYPLEISGAFVPYLHGWVPFTYTVAAFRSTISGGEDIGGCLLFLLVLTAVFSVLTALEFKIRAARIRKGGRTLIEWLEAHGLA